MFIDFLHQEIGSSKGAGGETRFNCPFCGETKYKMYVSNDKGLWICFKCSKQGNPVSFVMQYYGVTFPEAKDILKTYGYEDDNQGNNFSKRYDKDLSEEEKLFLFITHEGRVQEEKRKNIKYKCPSPPTNCKNLYNNFNNPEALPFFQYLHRRGVTLEQIKKHNMSYVTRGEVSLSSDRKMTLVNHLVFFTLGDKGESLYWNTRSVDPNPYIKSFNAPSKEDEHSKNNTIFNLNNVHLADKIVVNEGVFDALTFDNAGVATFGKKVTKEQINLLISKAKRYNLPIYIFLDQDASQESSNLSESIRDVDNSIPVYLVYNTTGKDANDLGKEKSLELVNQAIEANTEGKFIFDIMNAL